MKRDFVSAIDAGTKAIGFAKANKLSDQMRQAEGATQRARNLKKQLDDDAAVASVAAPVVATAAAAVPAVGPTPVSQEPETTTVDPVAIQNMIYQVAANSGIEEALRPESVLMDAGLDSLSSIAFRNALQKLVGFKLPAALLFDHPTVQHVVDYVVEEASTRN